MVDSFCGSPFPGIEQKKIVNKMKKKVVPAV